MGVEGGEEEVTSQEEARKTLCLPPHLPIPIMRKTMILLLVGRRCGGGGERGSGC